MNATKRKFNALLQGLGNPPPPSPATQSLPPRKTMDYESLLQKRRRLGFPESTAPKRDPAPSSGIASPLRRPGQQSSDSSGDPSLARYAPSSRDDLLRRLATFQELTDWTPKPDEISEVEWARWGWVCKGKERVRCLLCHKELVVKLKREEVEVEVEVEGKEKVKEVDEVAAEGLEKAMVSRYQELIVTAHQSDCLWRRQGCDESLLRISFASTKSVMEDLKKRYHELCARHAFLPYEFNLRPPEAMHLDEVIHHLPPDFFSANANDQGPESSPSPSPSPNRPALALALLGWQGLTNPRIGAVPHSASCHTCLRRLGLWMFKSKEVDEQGQVLTPAPMDHLDPVREHRFFCPWKNAGAQSRRPVRDSLRNNADEPAWKTLLQSIKNDYELRNVYEGRSTPLKSAKPPLETPSTLARGGGDESMVDAQAAAPQTQPRLHEEEMARNAKDKERWARLRKVKSLFDTKKLRRPMTIRPGMPQSFPSLSTQK